MFLFLIFVLLNHQDLVKADLGCGDVLISGGTSYTCNSPIFTKTSLPNLVSGQKEVYLQAEVKFQGLCSGTQYPFATLTIEPSTGSTVKLMSVWWDGSQKFTLKSQGTTSIQDVFSIDSTDTQYAGSWFSFSAWVNLNTHEASALFIFYGPKSVPSTNTVSYGSTWTINMNPRIYPCSDGTFQAHCTIRNLKVWYQGPSNLDMATIVDGTTPLLLAQYKLNQYNGYEVIDSAPTPLGSAYFGSSTSSGEDPVAINKPSWVPEKEAGSDKLMDHFGLVFDQKDAYVTMPSFSINQALEMPASSMTIKMWIKLSSTLVPSAYLFRYSQSDGFGNPGVDIFAIQMELDRTITVTSFTVTTTFATSLSPTDWNSIVVTFTSLDYHRSLGSLALSRVASMINDSPESSVLLQTSLFYFPDASNIMRLGGPPTVLGVFAGVEIYSPGSNFMTAATACQAATCQRDLGVTSPSTCILPVCTADCAVCFDSQDAGCLACNPGYYLYQSKCLPYECEPGKYLDFIGNCQDCIANCERCTDDATCDICETGFILPLCECPSSSLFDSSTNSCQPCITHCDQCSDSISCEVCSTGFIKQGTICVCPSGSVLDTSTNSCQVPVCIAHCDQCIDSISCDVCSAGFTKQGSICVCPSGSVLDTATDTCQIPNNSGNNGNTGNSGNPCSNTSYFYYPTENYCKSTCDYPYKIVTSSPLQYCVLDIDEKDAEQANTVAQVGTITNYVTNFGGILVGLFSSSNFGLLLMESLTEMLSYIQYLKIDYPPKVYLMLYEQDVNSGGLNIITEIPEEVEDAIPNRPLPEEFAKNDTHSSFVSNTWEFLISLSSILISIGFISVLSPLLKKSSKLCLFLSKVLSSLKWNLFFGVFCSGYGFTAIFTALEFRTVNMNSGLSIMSFIICLIINTLGFFAFYLVFQISLAFTTIKKAIKNPEEQAKQIEETEKNWKSYTAIFEDYKNDHLSQKLFLFLFMLRTYIHYSILGYLNDYPFLQTCFFTAISIATVLYLLIRRPMKSKMNFVQQIVCEVAILVVNVCVVILSAMDKWMIGDYSLRVKIGDVIIAVNFGLSIAGSVFMVIETASQIKELYSFIKTWSQRNESQTSQVKKGVNNPYKIQKARHNVSYNLTIENLELSDLDKSNDISIDPLKPH